MRSWSGAGARLPIAHDAVLGTLFFAPLPISRCSIPLMERSGVELGFRLYDLTFDIKGNFRANASNSAICLISVSIATGGGRPGHHGRVATGQDVGASCGTSAVPPEGAC